MAASTNDFAAISNDETSILANAAPLAGARSVSEASAVIPANALPEFDKLSIGGSDRASACMGEAAPEKPSKRAALIKKAQMARQEGKLVACQSAGEKRSARKKTSSYKPIHEAGKGNKNERTEAQKENQKLAAKKAEEEEKARREAQAEALRKSTRGKWMDLLKTLPPSVDADLPDNFDDLPDNLRLKAVINLANAYHKTEIKKKVDSDRDLSEEYDALLAFEKSTEYPQEHEGEGHCDE